jgi:hypothetical protein
LIHFAEGYPPLVATSRYGGIWYTRWNESPVEQSMQVRFLLSTYTLISSMVELRSFKPKVAGSTPAEGTDVCT